MTISKPQENISEVGSVISSLKEDESVPKNIKAKLDIVVSIMAEDCQMSEKVGKALHMMDEMSEDLNIQPFVRTQIWNISSMLEKLNH